MKKEKQRILIDADNIFFSILGKISIILIPILLYLTTQFYYYYSNTDFKKKIYIPTHLLGIFILILFFVFLTGIFRTTKRSTITISIILFIFMIINQIKIGYALDPVMFSDVFFLNDTGSLLEITGSTMINMIISMVPLSILYLIVLIIINIYASKLTFTFDNMKFRVASTLICFLMLFVIYFPNDNVTIFMQNHVFDVVTAEDNNHTTTNIAYYQRHGVISGMYGMLLLNRFIEPDEYNDYKDKLDDIMADGGDKQKQYVNDELSSWGQPNIIIIFSESFWDVDKLEEVEFDKKVTSNLARLKETGIYAEMVSPSFGGVSANVEYEVLTGSNIKFFSEGFIPYMQLINNSDYYDAPYVSTVLSNNNYKTKFVSTWKSTLFNCGKVYDYMGIDDTMFSKDFVDPDMKGKRISEAAVVDQIINDLESKEHGQRIFHLSLTAQTHMPYYEDRYEEYDIDIKSSPLTDEGNEMLRCYAQGVYDADKQLGRLYDYLQEYDEPTIVIFYGDHLPYLNSDDYNVYDELEYFNTDDYLTNYYRKYNTQLLITANFDLGKDDIDYIGPDLIMPYVFSRCDFENESDYYNYLASTAYTLPTFNSFVAVDYQGNLYNPEDLPDDLYTVYSIRRCINWREYMKK